MSVGYQTVDAHLLDYSLYELPGTGVLFRGPPLTTDKYVACIGAAQTFGRFVETPFPALISYALGVGALNLGRAGAGPEFFLCTPRVLEYANTAAAVVVQVLSARSQSNSLFETVDYRDQGISRPHGGGEMIADEFYTWLLGEGEQRARHVVEETRDNYVAAMCRLLDAIKPPKILLWFSVRSPDYDEQLKLPIGRLYGEFPQLVNRRMIEQMRAHSDRFIECVSREGLPQPIVDRSGKSASYRGFSRLRTEVVMRTENRYYPSPEMHQRAAALLVAPCRELICRE